MQMNEKTMVADTLTDDRPDGKFRVKADFKAV